MEKRAPSSNPITRARLQVEAEVPPSRRGPGWDRHWRELEAYFDAQGDWSFPPSGKAEPESGETD
ncbi:hypothetical protein [Altericroceibacterium xinjiangense]|uniref:hypothetical protein n=1 Tax=Altericroceibacterium xinjiangense TaxID=762261 RepID=UPI000F7F2816|nr:hypothetical protein [Altericroceibacterium xinjiangense]